MGDYNFRGLVPLCIGIGVVGALVVGGCAMGITHLYNAHKAKQPVEYQMTAQELSDIVQKAGGSTNDLYKMLQK